MLPMIKLGGLVARTLTKPLARVVKSRSKAHPLLNATCEHLGQQQHRMSMKLHMGFRGISNYTIKPLPADQAVEHGADLIGELLIFSVALGVASLEYSRSAATARLKEAKQKELQLQEERELEARFEYLESQVVWLENCLMAITKIIENEIGTRLEVLVTEDKRYKEKEIMKLKPLRAHRREQQNLDMHVGVDIDDKVAEGATSSIAKVWATTYNAVSGLFK
ncbi:Predicted coiled-coil protein [Plasmopara halstedii]|uniref:Predicted coiled-coil protein n=1 Tax=Plasmopara halstedii TaxID=4781 RepID=A0A0N7L7I6_PLAHL|nr:Predicted coiled-coil protein [Plasmopara halstedii]CEG47179.1 Predicted coiled-coil protein [Plasmopara halstedii]|eukprot:XP_024583548.1 Predicted coiled-coil protein [Plasmopara halstedii]